MTLPATIYARFSNAEQATGDSQERQLRACREMLVRHGWLGDSTREIIDEGKSAFTGSNRSIGGKLYDFEQQAEAGQYSNGHVLVVENLDRISRQGYDEIIPFLQKLTGQGVTVATVDGDRIYPAYERVTMVAVIEAVLKSELAREESEKKSKRNESAWRKKIEQAQLADGIAVTRTVPAWINVHPETRAMSLNEDRTALLREIFDLTIEGYGTPAIAKRLNARGEPVWGHLGAKSKNGWTVGYLTKLVLNRAVMGEYHPMKKPRSALRPESKGIAILNYFPQAIDPATFTRAHVARQSRKGTSGAWQISHNNLFSGIAVCAECGGRMKQEVTVKAGGNRRTGKNRDAVYQAKADISYLRCHNALNKVFDEERGAVRCTNKARVRYEHIERAVLDIALHFAATNTDNSANVKASQIEVELAEARRQLADKEQRVATLNDSFSRTGSPSTERLIIALDDQISEDQAAIKQLEQALIAEQGAISPLEHHERIAAMKATLGSTDERERSEARVRVKQALRGIVTRIECNEHRETIVTLGRDAMRVIFDNEGNQLHFEVTQQTVYGPDGEPDWHPEVKGQ